MRIAQRVGVGILGILTQGIGTIHTITTITDQHITTGVITTIMAIQPMGTFTSHLCITDTIQHGATGIIITLATGKLSPKA
jgi:hypothetical protein